MIGISAGGGDGATVGVFDGGTVGVSVGLTDGGCVGPAVGSRVGGSVGGRTTPGGTLTGDFFCVGAKLGVYVGDRVGTSVGDPVGCFEGATVGVCVFSGFFGQLAGCLPSTRYATSG